jgi:hypothetical protein
MENLKIVLPALVALIGTLVVAFVGYRQWKRQHFLARAGAVWSEKQLAYKVIWRKLEDVHLFIRSQAFDRNRYLELVRKVNIEMMRSGLLLERGEARIVNEYLSSMEAFASCLDEIEDAESTRERVSELMYTTLALPPDIGQKSRDFQKAYDDLEGKRELVIQRFRHAIGADMI